MISMENKELMKIIKAITFIIITISVMMIAYNMGMENAFRIQEWVKENCPCAEVYEASIIGVKIGQPQANFSIGGFNESCTTIR